MTIRVNAPPTSPESLLTRITVKAFQISTHTMPATMYFDLNEFDCSIMFEGVQPIADTVFFINRDVEIPIEIPINPNTHQECRVRKYLEGVSSASLDTFTTIPWIGYSVRND